MAVETAAERAAFFDAEEFGVTAMYTAVGLGPIPVDGIFTNPFLIESSISFPHPTPSAALAIPK